MICVCKVLNQSCPQRKCVETCCVSKRKCREIGELPSMMWKRSIVQTTVGNVHVAATLTVLVVLLTCVCKSKAAELVIEIPGSGLGEDSDGGEYRLDYRPPYGSPEPNIRVPARASTIKFQGLPGTKYHFMLYYSNATFPDLLTWNQTIITGVMFFILLPTLAYTIYDKY